MMDKNIPINKGNYSLDTDEREAVFEKYRSEGWEEEYGQYRKHWIEFPQKQIVSEYPLLVDVELASICNLRCPMCYTITDEFKNKVNTALMDFGLFKKIIDEVGYKVPALRLSLRGEPTLHPKFIDCIRYAKEHGIKEVSFLTNGSRLTGDFFVEIMKAGADWITISVDGIGETYEKIRQPIKFDNILEKIKNIKKYKDEHGLHRPVIKVQGIWPAIRENPEQYYDTFAPYVDLVAFNPLIDYLGNDEHIVYMDDFACPQQYQRLVIGADGLAMKCSNDEESEEIIGDVKQKTAYQVWHGEKMNEVREMHQQKQGFLQSAVCRKCYLPRQTYDEVSTVHEREFLIMNYVNRKQVIGQ